MTSRLPVVPLPAGLVAVIQLAEAEIATVHGTPIPAFTGIVQLRAVAEMLISVVFTGTFLCVTVTVRVGKSASSPLIVSVAVRSAVKLVFAGALNFIHKESAFFNVVDVASVGVTVNQPGHPEILHFTFDLK
jgi:hypothetical protein